MAAFIVQMTDAEIIKAIKFACEVNGVPELAKQITFKYNSRYRATAGTALCGQNSIQLSAEIFEQFTKTEQYDTVVHEACHLVTRHKHGAGVKAHGKEWKAAMIACGLPPTVKYSRKKLRSEGGAPVPLFNKTFACQCRKGLRISYEKAKLIKDGRKLKCQFCKTALVMETQASSKPDLKPFIFRAKYVVKG